MGTADEPADEPIDEPTDEPSDEPAEEPAETPTDNGSEENPNTSATAGSAAMLAILGGAAIIAVPDIVEVKRYFSNAKDRINTSISNKLDSY